MERFRLVEELVLRYRPSPGVSQTPEVLITATVILAVAVAVWLAYVAGGHLKLPVAALVLLSVLGGCSGETKRHEEQIAKPLPLIQYSGTVVVERQSGLREAFGVKPGVKKAWLIRATYPGSSSAMSTAVGQLNTLLSSQDMGELATDSHRAEFVKRCYIAVGFSDVQIIDPQNM